MAQPDEDQPARPLRRDAERNRQRILAAATEVFASRGLQATLDDVAHAAGVGVGTVYRRFPDRESLVEALFEQRIQSLVTLAEQALEAPDSWLGLVTMLERAATLLARDRGLREILLFATYGHNRVELARRRMPPVVTKVVERAQRDGELRTDLQPTDVAFIEFMLASAAEYAGAARPEIWRRYLALIIDGLRPSRDGVSTLPADALTAEEMVSLTHAAPQRRR